MFVRECLVRAKKVIRFESRVATRTIRKHHAGSLGGYYRRAWSLLPPPFLLFLSPPSFGGGWGKKKKKKKKGEKFYIYFLFVGFLKAQI